MEVRASSLVLCLVITILFKTTTSSIQSFHISPGFRGAQMNWIDNNGVFLLSNSSNFGFGFITYTPTDITSFLLVVMHLPTTTVVWTANRDSPVTHSDNFAFTNDGNANLQSGGATIWSTNTSGKGATAMVLRDSGNLVVLAGESSTPLWQSFSFPTDTLLSGQSFVDGMTLVSKPNSHNLSYSLTIQSGDMMLYANFQPRQPYWSMQKDSRSVANKVGGDVYSATLVSNSWDFYDQKQDLLWQFIIDANNNENLTWAAVLGNDGQISLYSFTNESSKDPSPTKIPQDSCSKPEACDPYYICYKGRGCHCPAILTSGSDCNRDIGSPCRSNGSFQLAKIEDGVGYFATGFVSPASVSNLTGCKDACMRNCSCVAVFHDENSGKCFIFDQIGSLQEMGNNSTSFVSYIKISGDSGDQNPDVGGGDKHLTVILVVCLVTATVLAALSFLAIGIQRRRTMQRLAEPSQDTEEEEEEEDSFLEAISTMPVRFRYRELQEATDNFTVKLGQGGFGSVYLGQLPDGTQVAVKKLEGIGQGRKEFRAEVTIIGSIHHVHLVRLRGFCAEGVHRLLAYEYMAKGSLDRWIFRDSQEACQLDWDTRYSIALGTAKGLAYLHEDCTSKILHCDIKPENVLLDDHFHAKVSDFGLAKLITREQSHVFTTLRGTRGYLAPEWITNYAISDKSDVYSYGMVLLEIIAGRKSYDWSDSSEKAHFPSYAYKMMEEGKLKEIFDARLIYDDKDGRVETAIKVALWCIQEDSSLRPPMTKVVQMLEGVSDVPQLPTSSQMRFRLYANMNKSLSEEGTSSGQSDCNSNTFLSAVHLSGPR